MLECEEVDKTEHIKLEFFMEPSNLTSKYSRHFAIFKDDCLEEWIEWLMSFREIESLMPIKEPAGKSMMIQTFLKAQALSYFEHHLRRRLDAEDAKFPDNDLLELVIKVIDLEYIPKQAIRMQRYYMRRSLFMGLNTSVQQFVERLNDINHWMLFP